MSSRFDIRHLTVLEAEAHAEAKAHFSNDLKQFAAFRESIERLERNLSIMAQAAGIAASNPAFQHNPVQLDDGTHWHKVVALMENVYLCHRLVAGEVEFAAVEHFPASAWHEIWNRGPDAAHVARIFIEEQRLALQVWAADMTAQIGAFLAEKYSGQDFSHVAASFTH